MPETRLTLDSAPRLRSTSCTRDVCRSVVDKQRKCRRAGARQ